jgi:hypothetical protein
VQVMGDEIIVTLLGTSYSVTSGEFEPKTMPERLQCRKSQSHDLPQLD